jgi:hypothetical protein
MIKDGRWTSAVDDLRQDIPFGGRLTGSLIQD